MRTRCATLAPETRRALVLIATTFSAACSAGELRGHRGDSVSEDPATEGESSGICRKHAKSGTLSGLEQGTFACEFTEQNLTYRCRQSGSSGEWEFFQRYASAMDFIAEGDEFAKQLYLERSWRDESTSFFYDEQGRLKRAVAPWGSVLYRTHDSHDRPTYGSVNMNGCEFPLDVTYDDENRVRTESFAVAAGCEATSDWTVETTWDADGTFLERRDDGAPSSPTFKVELTGEWCLPLSD